MATLRKGTQIITVPDDTISSYIAEGWTDVNAPAPEPAKKKSRSRAAKKTTKGASDGVSVRADSDPGAPQKGGEPEQPE